MKVALIDDWCRKMFTLASTRLAWAAGVATAYFAANPDQWQQIMDRLPWWGPIAVGLITTLVAGGSRVVAFKKET